MPSFRSQTKWVGGDTKQYLGKGTKVQGSTEVNVLEVISAPQTLTRGRRPESGIVDAITDAVTSGHSQIRELCIGFSIDKKKLQDCLAQVLPHLRHITKLSVRTYKPVDGCTHRLWQRWCLRPVDYIHHDGRHSFVYNMNKHLEVEGVITKQTPGHSAREVVWTARKGTTLVWKSEGHGCEE